MATYDYRCEDCQHEFSVAENISEHDVRDTSPPCPECSSDRTVRVFTGFFAKTARKS
jgi:putative FmdB family regulatory protein